MSPIPLVINPTLQNYPNFCINLEGTYVEPKVGFGNHAFGDPLYNEINQISETINMQNNILQWLLNQRLLGSGKKGVIVVGSTTQGGGGK